MWREEVIGDARLILADCRDVLPTLSCVDAVVTDPPYGIGFKYESHIDSREGYGEWLWSVLKDAEARLAPGGPVFVWQAAQNIRYFSDWFPRDWRLLVGAKNFVQMRHTAMQYAYDPIVVWWNDGKVWWNGVNRDWHVADSASVVSDTRSLARQHPCPRPLDQVEFVVATWCRPACIVFDPFMGSGTTGVACARRGRQFIGIEIEPRYFDIACRRVEDAQRQGDLLNHLPMAEDPADVRMADLFREPE